MKIAGAIGVLTALILVVGIGFVALGLSRQNALGNCERGNKLRMESNRRIQPHRIDRDVLNDFLKSAAQARRATGDAQVAHDYDQLRRRLRAVTFRDIPLVDCREAIPLLP